jgi:hypothetical protein
MTTTSTSQFELFESFNPEASRAPKLELPFQKSSEIDVKRAQRILGITKRSIHRMLQDKRLSGYRAVDKNSSPWRIEYSSVVAYCDKLRMIYAISDRRVGRKPGARCRDHELLPFPLSETIGAAEVRKRLDCSHAAVLHLIDTGSLVGYQVVETTGSPWRIHAPSLEAYIRSLHVMAGKGPSSRPSAPAK